MLERLHRIAASADPRRPAASGWLVVSVLVILAIAGVLVFAAQAPWLGAAVLAGLGGYGVGRARSGGGASGHDERAGGLTDAGETIPSAGPDPALASHAPPSQDLGLALTARAALDAMAEPILVIARSGRIELANDAARRRFELRREAVLLSSVFRHPEVLEAVNAAHHGADPHAVSYRVAGTRERHMRAFVRAVELDGERRALVTLHDETAVRQAERMRVDFLANASHELRTPLASLSGFIETLRGHAKNDAEARERFLAIMHEQALRMSRLIDDLLSLSRIEQNEHVPPTGVTDLLALANEVLDTLTPVARERNVRLELQAQNQAATVLGDGGELGQVLQNLVDNAIKYSPDGGRVVVELGAGASLEAASYDPTRLSVDAVRLSLVSPRKREGSGLYAWARVRDAGPGIARQNLPRLAERFYRVEGSDTRKRRGTGLGLAIVKHIILRHRGGFTVESAIGEGTVFTILVPHTPEFTLARSGPSSLPPHQTHA